MSRHHRPTDPPSMTAAIDALDELGVKFDRPTEYQLKLDDLIFYPGRGTIFKDGTPKAMPEKGLQTFLDFVEGMKLKRQPAPSFIFGPDPNEDHDTPSRFSPPRSRY